MNEPVPTTLATAVPLMLPMKPLEMTATLAGPPCLCPASAIAKSLNSLPIPDFAKNAPNKINKKIKVTEAPMADEYKPSVFRYICPKISLML